MPPHLAQLSVAAEERADQQAQQGPSHIPILTPRQVRAVAAESAQSTRVTDVISERIMEAPVVVTQRELCAMAPDAWAQAASASKRERKEQPLFMMMEDILGDAYEPDVPRTTAQSVRLAQMADDYAAAALSHSQPDALPPHAPFRSNPSQPNQSKPEPCQSTQAHPPSDTEESHLVSSTKRYEHISLKKVGATPLCTSNTANIRQNKPQPPEQQADEPRFALQNVATSSSHRRESESSPPPIHPLQPPVTAEVTPPSVVAAEAPPSLLAATQQQSAPLSFPSLRFTPFCSLLTSYHVPTSLSVPVHIPNLQRKPPQPPQPPLQHRLQCEPPPEESEQEEKRQEDEQSDDASQSSPSSSSPKPSLQHCPSALAVIALLAESFRAEIAAIQEAVTQTGCTAHKYSATLTTFEEEVQALVVLASNLDHCTGDSSEQEHAEGFGTLMDRLGVLMTSARAVEDSTTDGAESNADRSTAEPEELEQEEELQDNEWSNCLSQSSPSLSSPELDPPQCRPSALDFIVPLAESLRAELSAIQDMVAQTDSTEHRYSAVLATLEDEIDALVALAHELNLRTEDSSEQEHAAGFGALIDRLGALMTSARAVEDNAEGNAEPDDTPTDNTAARYSTGPTKEEEEESNRNRSSSIGEEGELSTLSWEEIPSSAYIPPIHFSLSRPRPRTIPSDFTASFLLSPLDSPPPSIPLDDSSAPICLYSPHTHADANPKLRTAFFSVGRRLGVAHDPVHPRRRPSPPRPRSTASAPRAPRRYSQQPATSPGMRIVRRRKKIKAFPVARQQVFKLPATSQR